MTLIFFSNHSSVIRSLASSQVYEQERGSSNLTALTVDEGIRRRDGRDEHHHQPSGNTASAAAPLWSQANQSLHPALQHTFDPMGYAGGGLGVRPGPRMDPSRVMMHPQQMPKRTGGGIQVGEHTGFLRMRGLPFSASKEDIYDFFIGYNPLLDSIVLTYRNDGRATGEAYVGFVSPGDAERAMALHRQSMGNRYIELFISNKEEHGRALARFGPR
jgi:RNA recognition motif. (a.k.a. RRM, RBD, or RNP domain)